MAAFLQSRLRGIAPGAELKSNAIAFPLTVPFATAITSEHARGIADRRAPGAGHTRRGDLIRSPGRRRSVVVWKQLRISKGAPFYGRRHEETANNFQRAHQGELPSRDLCDAIGRQRAPISLFDEGTPASYYQLQLGTPLFW
jgi:hypothetical protein